MSKPEKSDLTTGNMRAMRMLAKAQHVIADSEPDPHYEHLQRVAARKLYEAARPRLKIVGKGAHAKGESP